MVAQGSVGYKIYMANQAGLLHTKQDEINTAQKTSALTDEMVSKMDPDGGIPSELTEVKERTLLDNLKGFFTPNDSGNFLDFSPTHANVPQAEKDARLKFLNDKTEEATANLQSMEAKDAVRTKELVAIAMAGGKEYLNRTEISEELAKTPAGVQAWFILQKTAGEVGSIQEGRIAQNTEKGMREYKELDPIRKRAGVLLMEDTPESRKTAMNLQKGLVNKCALGRNAQISEDGTKIGVDVASDDTDEIIWFTPEELQKEFGKVTEERWPAMRAAAEEMRTNKNADREWEYYQTDKGEKYAVRPFDDKYQNPRHYVFKDGVKQEGMTKDDVMSQGATRLPSTAKEQADINAKNGKGSDEWQKYYQQESTAVDKEIKEIQERMRLNGEDDNKYDWNAYKTMRVDERMDARNVRGSKPGGGIPQQKGSQRYIDKDGTSRNTQGEKIEKLNQPPIPTPEDTGTLTQEETTAPVPTPEANAGIETPEPQATAKPSTRGASMPGQGQGAPGGIEKAVGYVAGKIGDFIPDAVGKHNAAYASVAPAGEKRSAGGPGIESGNPSDITQPTAATFEDASKLTHPSTDFMKSNPHHFTPDQIEEIYKTELEFKQALNQ